MGSSSFERRSKIETFGDLSRSTARFVEEGDAFLSRVVTCDETWVSHYTPESKQASMEGREKGEAAPVKAKTRLSDGKVFSTVFFDQQGILLIEFLHERRTINAAYYYELLAEARCISLQKAKTMDLKGHPSP